MYVSSVFLDTNILKFAATILPRMRPRKQLVEWCRKTIEVTLHDFVEVNRNEFIVHSVLKAEAELLPLLAEIGKLGKLEYVMSGEKMIENWGLRNMDRKDGRFCGATIKVVKAPLDYAYILAGGEISVTPMERQFHFLASIKHKRFLVLQKMTGAYQGERELNRNQHLDAFHIWCAEHNECEFFLTLDFKLIKV
jgi:hypothetical protein